MPTFFFTRSPRLGKTDAAQRAKMYFLNIQLKNFALSHAKIVVIVTTAKPGDGSAWPMGGAG